MSENKKLALLRVYQILRDYSDRNHPMTQNDLLERLRRTYGIEVDRRAVGRNLSLLKEAGIEIESDRWGSWLSDDERLFLKSELRVLIDLVAGCPSVPEKQSDRLIERLCSLTDVRFLPQINRRKSGKTLRKTDSQMLFYNVEILEEIIECGEEIRFIYLRYGADRKLVPAGEYTVLPRGMAVVDGGYCLLTASGESFRVERIRDLQRTSRRPKETGGEKEMRVTLVCRTDRIGELLETFGDEIEIRPHAAGLVRADIQTTERAARAFVRRQMPAVGILEPAALRRAVMDELRADLRQMEEMNGDAA